MAEIPPCLNRAIGRRFIIQARNYLQQGDRLQAGGKAWAAIAQNLKIIGERRGWKDHSTPIPFRSASNQTNNCAG